MPNAHARAHTTGSVPLRIGEEHRHRAAALLGQAAADGYLTLHEMDTRLAAVHRSSTADDLDALLSDLPVPELRRRAPAARSTRAARAHLGLRVHIAAYMASTTFMVALWLVIALSADAWYPWPVWPALGGGAAVLIHALALRAAVPTLSRPRA